MFKLTKFCVQSTLKEFFRQNNRFKGHAKWQNIKHIKEEKDYEKAVIFSSLLRRMKVAIAEGGSIKPYDNPKLTSVIDEAKRKSMPVATINGFLEKVEKTKFKSQVEYIDFKSPGNAIFLVKLLCDNIKGTRMEFNILFKKNACTAGEGRLKSVFEHNGFIITEIKGNLNAAMEDAINVGAEEVELIEDNGKFYQFTCDPIILIRMKGQLEKLDYKIITFDDVFVPRSMTTVSDADLQKIDNLCSKLKARDDVVAIYHNIELPEEEEQTVESKS